MHIYQNLVSVCVFVRVHVRMKPEINLKITYQVLSMLILESNSLMNLLSSVGFGPVSPSDLPVCSITLDLLVCDTNLPLKQCVFGGQNSNSHACACKYSNLARYI